MNTMKDRKTKFIEKNHPVQMFTKSTRRKHDDHRQQPHINPAIRKKLYHQIKQINREQTCPFLVRIFYAINDENYYKSKSLGDLPTDREIKLHLWMNSTLKQISELIRAMMPSVRTKQKFMFWRLIYSKEKKQYEKEELGWVYASKRYDKVEQKALCHTKFKIGNMIDLSITYK